MDLSQTGRLGAGWTTDLGVLRLSGASIEDRGTSVVIRTPANPTYHWGNFLLVTDPAATNEADRWLAQFHADFPEADHVALGFVAAPSADAWTGRGVELEENTVLATTGHPRLLPLADGYEVRALAGDDDWDGVLDQDLAMNAEDGRFEPDAHRTFLERRNAARREVIAAGQAQWFGAFSGGRLVASLGIVLCGSGTARYQAVATSPDHRRRGLAGHLLGVAARWAAEHGAREWVILTEWDNPAGRLYRSVGFVPVDPQHQAYSPGPTAR